MAAAVSIKPLLDFFSSCLAGTPIAIKYVAGAVHCKQSKAALEQ